MDKDRESFFFVLYSAQHQRCGRFVERTDFRVVTHDDLLAWSRDVTSNGAVQPLPLHCDTCAEDLQATHIRILKDADSVPHTVVPDIKIANFNPDDWILKMKGEV